MKPTLLHDGDARYNRLRLAVIYMNVCRTSNIHVVQYEVLKWCSLFHSFCHIQASLACMILQIQQNRIHTNKKYTT